MLLSLCSLLCSSALGQKATPSITWQAPAAVPFGTPLSSVQLNATVSAGPAISVPLETYYNVTGIRSAGVAFYDGGFDASLSAYPGAVLHTPVTWQGVPFQIGPPDAPDAVSNPGDNVALPAGKFSKLLLLADAVNNQVPALQQFTISYTDGTSTVIQQQMSDWQHVQGYPGEASVLCSATRNLSDGTLDNTSVCLHGYSFTLDSTKTVSSIALPYIRNVVVVSMELLPPAVTGIFTYSPAAGAILPSGSQTLNCTFTPSDPGSFTTATASVPITVTPPKQPFVTAINWPVPQSIQQGTALSSVQLNATATSQVGPVLVPLSDASTLNALYADDQPVRSDGIDGKGDAYSSTALGSPLTYGGFVFPLGPAGVPNGVTSATVLLPGGNFSTLYLLGSAISAEQLAQPFTVTYTDGTTTTQAISLSAWTASSAFPGETVVATTSYQNYTGGKLPQTAIVYGYQLKLDSSKGVRSLTLPTNAQVVILAAGLGTGASTNAPGSFVYSPAAGTVLGVGVQALSVTFSPTAAADFKPATATNSITVTPAPVPSPDFTFTTPSGTTIAAVRGQSAQIALQLSPSTTPLYPGDVAFSVTGQLPTGWTAVFSPASLKANAGPQNVKLTLGPSTQALLRRPAPDKEGLNKSAEISLGLVLLLPFATIRRLRSYAKSTRGSVNALLLVFAVLVLTFSLSGCGSGYKAVTYTVTVHAVSGSVEHTIPLTLNFAAAPQ